MSRTDYLKYNSDYSFLLNNYLSRDPITNINPKLYSNKNNLYNSKQTQLSICSSSSGDDDDNDKYSFNNNLNLLKLKRNKQNINIELFNFFFNK